MHKIADVLLPIPIDKTFSYKVEASYGISIGQLVSVPFRTRTLTGVITNISQEQSLDIKIKPINSTFPFVIKRAIKLYRKSCILHNQPKRPYIKNVHQWGKVKSYC